jgi:hypothetical protein
VRFQVITAVGMKMTAFLDIAQCVLLKKTYISEERTASITGAKNESITVMMEAVRMSQMSVFNENTRCYIPEGCELEHHLIYET